MGCLVEDAPVVTAADDFPELVVEWLPCAGPMAPGGDWCDISAYTDSVSSGGGRQYETGNHQAQDMTVVLKDAGRLFDEENTTGVFYPYLRTLKQIRWSAVYGGVRYPKAHAFITDFGDAIPGDAFFQQTITAKDGFLILDQIELTKTWFELEVEKDRPSHWWKLDEENFTGVKPIDAGTGSDVGRVVGFYDGGLPTLGAQAIVPYDGSRPATTWDDAWINLPTYAPDSDSPGFTVEGWFTLADDALPADTSRYPLWWFGKFNDTTGEYNRLQLNTYGTSSALAGQLTIRHATDTGIIEAASGFRVDDGLPHHYVAKLTASGGAVSLSIDGVEVATDSGAASDWMGSVGIDPITMRGALGSGYFTTSPRTTFPGTQSHVVLYEAQHLSAERIADHYAAGFTAFSGDRSGERAARMLDYYGWPELLRDIDTGTAIIGAHDIPSGTLLSYLQALSGTELGAMFMDPENHLVFRGRFANYTDTRSTTSQATFGDGHSSSPLKYVMDGFSLRRDEAQIHNPVTAQRQGGVSVTREDTALSDKETGYGPRDYAMPTSLERDDGAMNSRANWGLARGKDPQPRLAGMTIRPRRTVELWPATLGLANQDRITVERTPLGIAPQESVDQWVESIKHKASPMSFETQVVGAPVDDTDYLIVGVSLIGTGRVG